MEHHSNLVPWQMLAQRQGATLKIIPVDERGQLDLPAYHALLGPRTKLVAVTHMSNVLGTVNPVREMIEAAKTVGARVLVDGAQSVPHMPVNVQSLGCDFLAFSGHKMCGPTGIGILYGREELLEAMDPFMGGGEMISKVTLDERSTWADLPNKFEAGTPDISGAIGLGVAVDYLRALGMDVLHAVEAQLTEYALRKLAEVPGLKVHGTAPERGGAVSFELAGVHPHDVAHFADKDGIAIRAGHMCAQPLMRQAGRAGAEPGQPLLLQHAVRRSTRLAVNAGPHPGVLHPWNWTTSTRTSSWTTTSIRAISRRHGRGRGHGGRGESHLRRPHQALNASGRGRPGGGHYVMDCVRVCAICTASASIMTEMTMGRRRWPRCASLGTPDFNGA
jgi:SufS family cysteine desulfurase